MLEMKYKNNCVKEFKNNPSKYHLQLNISIVHPIHQMSKDAVKFDIIYLCLYNVCIY